MRHPLRVGALMVAGALALSVATMGSASADPKFTPDNNDIVGVGSDTTQFLVTDLAGAFNKAKVGGSMRLASWDATGSATIVPRKGAEEITRPNGSSAGIAELRANPDISFARSSRGPNATGDEGTSFYPFAQDKLGYVYAHPKSDVPDDLTAQDLYNIYTCQDTDWSDFGMPAGHIEAKVPQAGSGTRTFFLASIGETEQQLEDAIAQPDNVCSVTEVEEHDPSAVIGQPDAVAPFSFARYSILDKKTKKKITYATNAPFNVTREVYNVIRTADSGKYDQFFNTSSWICTSAQAQKIVQKEGFILLPAGQCGVPLIA